MPRAETAVQFYTVPAGTQATTCRGEHCQKRMYWISNPQTGRMIPIDCDVEGGEAPSTTKDRGQLDVFSDKEAPVYDGRGVSHFTTCVDAGAFSRTRHD